MCERSGKGGVREVATRMGSGRPKRSRWCKASQLRPFLALPRGPCPTTQQHAPKFRVFRPLALCVTDFLVPGDCFVL